MEIQHPAKYCCPIGGGLMHDPVKMENGKSYERDEITKYLKNHSYKLPRSNKTVSLTSMKEDRDLKNEINEYLKKNKLVFDVFIKNIDNKFYLVHMKYNDTITELRNSINKVFTLSKDCFMLFQNKILDEKANLKLSDYNFEHGSIVNILYVLQGG